MVSYLKASLVTIIALFALVLTFTNVRAEDKKTCGLCDEVKVVLGSLRCEKCTADKQCDVCQKHCADTISKLACKDDKNGTCATCTKALEANKCKFCAAKMFLISQTYCCTKCAGADAKTPGAADKCTKCTAMPLAAARPMLLKVECKEKDCPNKKK